CPVRASSATSWLSSVSKYTIPYARATPRFTGPQQIWNCPSLYVVDQYGSPVVAFTAMTFIWLLTVPVVRYITPCETMGVVSKLAAMPVCTIATGVSEEILLVV